MKTKALIIFAVTAKLICVFVFAYAKSRFSHDEAHIKTAKIKGADQPKQLHYEGTEVYLGYLKYLG